jgi:hypothetical protein
MQRLLHGEMIDRRLERDNSQEDAAAVLTFVSQREQRHKYENYVLRRQEKEFTKLPHQQQRSYGEFYKLKSTSQIHFATGNSDAAQANFLKDGEQAALASRQGRAAPQSIKNLHLAKSPDARAAMAHLPSIAISRCVIHHAVTNRQCL